MIQEKQRIQEKKKKKKNLHLIEISARVDSNSVTMLVASDHMLQAKVCSPGFRHDLLVDFVCGKWDFYGRTKNSVHISFARSR